MLRTEQYTDSSRSTVYRAGRVDVQTAAVNWSASGYRLPTEAEWEKAARGGLRDQWFPWPSQGGTAESHLSGDKANSCGSGDSFETTCSETVCPGGTTPVGYYAPNGNGIYDMAGNVYELCWDRIGSIPQDTWYSQPGATTPDTRGPESGPYRAIRGGSWAGNADLLRCASRYNGDPAPPDWGVADGRIGFRCVRGR